MWDVFFIRLENRPLIFGCCFIILDLLQCKLFIITPFFWEIYSDKKLTFKGSEMKRKSQSERVVEYVLSCKIEELATLSVEHIATSLNINRSHLSRTFKAERSCTIEQYLFRIKIIHAATILKTKPKMPIKEVSKKIGFCRCDYFSRLFKNFFGATPAKYRELALTKK